MCNDLKNDTPRPIEDGVARAPTAEDPEATSGVDLLVDASLCMKMQGLVLINATIFTI